LAAQVALARTRLLLTLEHDQSAGLIPWQLLDVAADGIRHGGTITRVRVILSTTSNS
jgi:hypothetical protein